MDDKVFSGCQGHSNTPTILERICPNCGEEVEIFSNEEFVKCEKCGTKVYSNVATCTVWPKDYSKSEEEAK